MKFVGKLNRCYACGKHKHLIYVKTKNYFFSKVAVACKFHYGDNRPLWKRSWVRISKTEAEEAFAEIIIEQ